MKSMLILFVVVLMQACATTVSHNTDLFALRDQAIASYQKGEYQQAVELYTQLVEAVPEDSELWFKKANAHAQLLQPVLAIESYQQAVLRNPKQYKAWRNMSIIHLRQAANALTQLMTVLPPSHPIYDSSLRLTQNIMALLDNKSSSDKKPAVKQ